MGHESESCTETLRDGTAVLIRAIDPGDTQRIAGFIKGLSAHSRHLLFLGGIAELSEAALARLCNPHEPSDAALVAVVANEGDEPLIGLGRYSARTAGEGAEISVAVADAWQHKGLGTRLISRLIELARARGIPRLYSVDAAANLRMRKLARQLGFREQPDPEDRHQVIYSLELAAPAADGSGGRAPTD